MKKGADLVAAPFVAYDGVGTLVSEPPSDGA